MEDKTFPVVVKEVPKPRMKISHHQYRIWATIYRYRTMTKKQILLRIRLSNPGMAKSRAKGKL